MNPAHPAILSPAVTGQPGQDDGVRSPPRRSATAFGNCVRGQSPNASFCLIAPSGGRGGRGNGGRRKGRGGTTPAPVVRRGSPGRNGDGADGRKRPDDLAGVGNRETGTALGGGGVPGGSSLFPSGRWRERPCRRAGHLRHPVHPVHPVFCLLPFLPPSLSARAAIATGPGTAGETGWTGSTGWQDGSSRVRAPRSMNKNDMGNDPRGRWRPGRPSPSSVSARCAARRRCRAVIRPFRRHRRSDRPATQGHTRRAGLGW